jgi:hypothetical protein
MVLMNLTKYALNRLVNMLGCEKHAAQPTVLTKYILKRSVTRAQWYKHQPVHEQ